MKADGFGSLLLEDILVSPHQCLVRAGLLNGVAVVVLVVAVALELVWVGMVEQVPLGWLKEMAWALVFHGYSVTLLAMGVYQTVLSHPASPKVPV